MMSQASSPRADAVLSVRQLNVRAGEHQFINTHTGHNG